AVHFGPSSARHALREGALPALVRGETSNGGPPPRPSPARGHYGARRGFRRGRRAGPPDRPHRPEGHSSRVGDEPPTLRAGDRRLPPPSPRRGGGLLGHGPPRDR